LRRKCQDLVSAIRWLRCAQHQAARSELIQIKERPVPGGLLTFVKAR